MRFARTSISLLAPATRTTNSSPPSRAAKSLGLMLMRSRSAMVVSHPVAARMAQEVIITLKRSRSKKRIAVCWRAASRWSSSRSRARPVGQPCQVIVEGDVLGAALRVDSRLSCTSIDATA